MRINRLKMVNGLVVLTSLVGYLEWGKGNHQFLAQAEFEVVTKLLTNPISAWHPFTLFPMIGQFLLVATLFQPTPSRLLTTSGIVCLGVLLGFMFVIGLLGLHFKIMISTLPFVALSILSLRLHHRNR